MNNNLLNIKEASKYLNISQETLRNWDKSGKLPPIKTVGGHRRYQKEKLDELIGIINKEEVSDVVAIYARVSSHEQKTKGDLDRQSQRISEYCAKKKFKVEYIIKDVGSGLSDTRAGFVKLSNLVIDKKITHVVIENKDRLTRFQYNFVEKMFGSYGVKVICIDKPDDEGDKEFINDLMMIIASFSGRLYGARSAKHRKEQKLKQQELDKVKL
jgi:excisionase family DNA binding protein